MDDAAANRRSVNAPGRVISVAPDRARLTLGVEASNAEPRLPKQR